MKFDKWDVPQVKSVGVDVGPSSQMPTSARSGADSLVEGANALAAGVSRLGQKFAAEKETAETFVARQRDLEFAEEASALAVAFRERRLEDALDTADTHDKIEALRQKHMANLPGKAAQDDYEIRSRVRAQTLRNSIEEHASSQRLAQYEKIAESTVNTMLSGAVANYTDPAKVEEQLALGLPTILLHLEKNLGLRGKQVEQALDAVQGKVYEAVLDTYKANKQFAAGATYLETVKAALGPRANAWKATLGDLADKAETERMSTEAWGRLQNEATDPVNGRFNPELAKAALVELYPDAAVRERIEADIEKEITTAVSAQRVEDAQRIARLSKMVRATGHVDRLSDDYTRLDDIGQDTADKLEETHFRQQRGDRAEARREQANYDSIAKSQFFQIPTLEERAAVTREVVDGMFPDASPARREEILKWAVAADNIVKKGQQSTHAEFARQVDSGFKALPKKRAQAFRDHISAWYYERALEDRPITDEEVTNKINRALLMHEVWGSNIYGFELEAAGYDYEPPVADDQPIERARASLSRPARPVSPTAPVVTEMTGAEILKQNPSLAGKINPAAKYTKNGNKFSIVR